jgi:hypothetical protein
MARKHLELWEELMRRGKKFPRSESDWNWTPITKADDITPQEDETLINKDMESVRTVLAREMAAKEAEEEAKRQNIENEAEKRMAEEKAKRKQEEQVRKWRKSKIKEVQDKFNKGEITNESKIAAITAIASSFERVPDSRDVLYPSQDPEKARSSISQVGQALAGGAVTTFTKGVAGGVSVSGGLLEELTPFDDTAKKIQKKGEVISEDSDLLSANLSQNRPGENKFVTTASTGVGSLVTSLLMARLSGTATSAVVIGAGAAGEQYRGAKEAGKDNTDALTTGLAAGTAEAALEKLGLDKFMGAKGSIVKKTLTRSITEGTQEAMQSLTQSGISASYTDVDIGEAIGEAVVEGGYGALIGGGVGFSISLGEKLQSKGVDPEEAQFAAEAVTAKITPIVEEEIGLPVGQEVEQPPQETPVQPEAPIQPTEVPIEPTVPVATGQPATKKSDLEPTPLEQEAIKYGSSKELAKSLYDRVQNFDKSLKLSKEQKDDLHQYVQFKMQDRANKPPIWVEEAFNNAQTKNTKRIEAQSAPQVGKTEKPKGSMKPIKKAEGYSVVYPEKSKDLPKEVQEEMPGDKTPVNITPTQASSMGVDFAKPQVKELVAQLKTPQVTVVDKDGELQFAYKGEAKTGGNLDFTIRPEKLGLSQERIAKAGLKAGDTVDLGNVKKEKGRLPAIKSPSGKNYLQNDKPLSEGRRVSKSPEDLMNLAEQLNKAGQANAILRKSGLRKRDAAGVFSSSKKKPGEEYIALKDKSIKDPEQYFTVLGHELSHAIEFAVNGDTKNTYKMLGDLTAEEKSTIESELRAIVENIETKEVADSKPSYYYKPTEMMARFVETLLIDKSINQKLAPTVTDKFYELASRSQPVQDLLDAVEMKLDKGFIQGTPKWFKDVRQIHVTKLGKRAGEQAYNALIVKRALEQRAIGQVEKLLKTKFKGVKDDPKLLFRAIESIKVTKDGIPTFGTHDFNDAVTDKEAAALEKDGWTFTSVSYKDGKPLKVYSRPRYTPEEAKRIFDQLSPKGQKLVKDFTAAKEQARDEFNREIMKDIYGIESNLEGWIHRGVQKGEAIKKTRMTIQKATLRKKQAGMSMKRKGGENYLEDARKQISKALVDGELSRINNEFISDQLARISKPIAKGSKPDPGWTEIVADKKGGLRLPGEGMKMLVEKEGGMVALRQQRYQIPTELVELYRDVRQVQQDASKATKVIDLLGKYWAINVLLHPATFGGTTAITNAMQYSGKVTRDFYIEVLTNLSSPSKDTVTFKKTRRNLVAPFVMLTPKGWNSVPEYVYGGYRTNFAGQFVSDNNFENRASQALDQYGNKALVVMSKLDAYFKKMIVYAESGNFADLEKRGMVAKLRKEEAQLIAEVNQVVDRYMLDYENKAPWIDKFDRNGGKLVKPFITFGYKIAKANSKYVTDAVDPTLSWQERTASLLTISTIIGAIYAFMEDREDEGETPAGDDDTPFQFKPGGRVYTGIKSGTEELYVRVAKYPFFALTAFGKNIVEGNYQQSMDLLLEQYGTLGPAADIFNIFMQNKNKFDTYKPTDALIGELTATLIPGFRMTGDIGKMIDTNEEGKVVSRKPDNFIQGLVGSSIPVWGSEELRAKMRGNKRTIEIPIIDTEESKTINSQSKSYEVKEATREKNDLLWAFFTGVYMNRIDPNEAAKFEIYKKRKAAEIEVVENLKKKNVAEAKAIAREHGLIIKQGTLDYYARQ